jgi:hypothetical protein
VLKGVNPHYCGFIGVIIWLVVVLEYFGFLFILFVVWYCVLCGCVIFIRYVGGSVYVRVLECVRDYAFVFD